MAELTRPSHRRRLLGHLAAGRARALDQTFIRAEVILQDLEVISQRNSDLHEQLGYSSAPKVVILVAEVDERVMLVAQRVSTS